MLTNLGVTNPIVSGALTGAGTGAAINAVTGQPITPNSLLMGALGGGVAGGIGSVLPDMGGGVIGSGLAGAATNVGATVAVNLVTGQPITAGSLAGAALIGGAVGAGIQVATDAAGNNTYQYEDGSSMTTNRTGTPVAVTDNSGAQVPVAAVDSRTGQPKQLAPVEEAQPKTPEQIAAQTTPPGPVAPPATVDVNNITQEQLNQQLNQNNPYTETKPISTVAVAPTNLESPVTKTDTTPVDEIPEIVVTAPRPAPVAPPVYVPPALTPPVQQVIPPSQPIPEVRAEPPAEPARPAEPPAEPTAPSEPVAPAYPPVYVPPVAPPQVQMPTYGPLGPTQWGKVGTVNLPGTNPGFFTNVPEQYAPQGVRSQYYWGQHPYQTGAAFSPEQYQAVPAPVAPWGLQQMYNPETQTINNLLRGVGQAAGQAPYNQPAAPRV